VADAERISAVQSTVGGEWVAAMVLSGGSAGGGSGAQQEHAGTLRQVAARVGGERAGESAEPMGDEGTSGLGEGVEAGGVLFGRDVRESGDPFSGGLGVAARWGTHADEGDPRDSASWAEISDGRAGGVSAPDQSVGHRDDPEPATTRQSQEAQTNLEEDEAVEPSGDETRAAISRKASGGRVATNGFEGGRGATDSQTDRWSAGTTAGGDSSSA